ncbi:MAG: LysR family transcriptional regulator [Clostridia bacterium]|nr:LysR family transcriptional regulator [Clostridia bacterium]
MNYEYYKIFYAVATHKNITRAAESLYSSQPAVSRVISNMETELNCKLFIRDKSGVRLTKEGEELFDRISEPCGKLLRADEDFVKYVKLEETTVYIGSTVTALYCFVFDFLEKFKKKYPNVHFRIHTGSSSTLIAELKAGRLDVVFNTTPFSGADALSVTHIKMFEDILVAGNAFKALKGKKLSLADLKKYPFILLPEGMSFRTHAENFFLSNGVRITPELEADSSSLIVPMVEQNWGIALVPAKMAEGCIEEGKIFKIDLEENIPTRYVTMVTDIKNTTNKPIRQMKKLVGEWERR